MRMRRRNNLAPRMEACESVWIQDPEALRGNWRSLMPDCRARRRALRLGDGEEKGAKPGPEPRKG